MLKSINKLIKERLAKGGPGSGIYPRQPSSIIASPHKAIGVKEEDIHPSVKWSDSVEVAPWEGKTGPVVWRYSIDGVRPGKRWDEYRSFNSRYYADKQKAYDALKNHLLTGKYDPRGEDTGYYR